MRKNSYYRAYGVCFAQIPAWSALSESEYQQRVRELVDEIVEEVGELELTCYRVDREGLHAVAAKDLSGSGRIIDKF